MRPRMPRAGGEGGQMVVMAVIAIVVLLGFLGLVVDVGRLYVVRQQLRNACDAAAGAGAPKLPFEPMGAIEKGFEYYCRNASGTPPSSPQSDSDYTIAGTGDTVRIITPYEGNNKRIYVRAQRAVPSLFMQVLGTRSRNVSAYAVGLQKGRQSLTSMLSPNTSGRYGVSTQPLDRTRADGERYAVVIEGNNLSLGLDAGGQQVGVVSTSQNIYLDSNNSVGRAMYGDTNYANHTDGNPNTSPDLLNPAPGASAGMYFIDPSYYLQQATAQGADYVTHGDRTFDRETVSGFYFVYGDITIRRDVIGTATFAATGRITIIETGSGLSAADTQNHLLFYAGADPSLDPTTYFSGPQFTAEGRCIHMNDNNGAGQPGTYNGSIYAPYGHVMIESNNIVISGAVVGDTVAISSFANGVTIRYDPAMAPPVAPGVMLIE